MEFAVARAVTDGFALACAAMEVEAPLGLEEGATPDELVGLRVDVVVVVVVVVAVAVVVESEEAADLFETVDSCLMDVALVRRLVTGAEVSETMDATWLAGAVRAEVVESFRMDGARASRLGAGPSAEGKDEEAAAVFESWRKDAALVNRLVAAGAVVDEALEIVEESTSRCRGEDDGT